MTNFNVVMNPKPWVGLPIFTNEEAYFYVFRFLASDNFEEQQN